MLNKILSVLVGGLLSFTLSAKVDHVTLERIHRKLNLSVNEGLPSSETYFVHQDKKGFIWICTDRGVARYDGFKFDVYTTANGLADNVIFYIEEDDFDRIWFIGLSGRLSYFKNGKIYPYKYNDKVLKAFGSYIRPLKKLHIDEFGNLYYCNNYTSILKINPSGKITKLQGIPFYNSIFSYDNEYFTLIGRYYTNEIVDINVNNRLIRIKSKFLEDDMVINLINVKGHKFLRLKNEVIDLGNKNNRKYFSEQITGIFAKDEFLCICTVKGVYIYNGENYYNLTKPPKYKLLQGHSISNLEIDSENGFWFTTLDNGVFYFPNLDVNNYRVGSSPSEDRINNLFKFRNKIYFTNINGYYNFLSGKLIYSNAVLTNKPGFEYKNRLVVKSSKKTNETLKFYDDKIESTEMENYSLGINGTCLIGGYKIIRLFPNFSYKILYQFIGNKRKNSVHTDCITEDLKNKRIYVGNLSGLFYYNGVTLSQEGIPNKLKNIRISSLLYDPKNGIWIGTRGYGIFLYKDNRIKAHLNVKNGLIDNQINELKLGKENVIWSVSNSGVSKIHCFSSSLIRIQNITKLIGILTSEINSVCEHNDSIYLGTKKGISVLNRNFHKYLTINKRQIKIKNITINDRETPFQSKNIVVDGNTDLIHLELVSSNFRSIFNRKYKYRISNNENWTYGTTGSIILLNIEHGNYEIQISYQNEFGVWVKPYTLVNIVKQPKFIESTSFIILNVFIVIIIAFSVVYYRIRLIRKRLKQKTIIEQLEQKSLIAQINPHFIFNSLNSIQSFLVYNENDKAERFLIKLAKLIRSTLSVSRENKISIEMEKQLLIEYLELEKMRFKDKFDYQIISSITTKEEKYIIPPMLIQPFVENSVLHGFIHKEELGEIRIEFISIRENVLEIVITDNGVGRDFAENKKPSGHRSFATDITRERLAAFKNKYKENFYFEIIDLKDDSNVPLGTKVVLKLPILGRN